MIQQTLKRRLDYSVITQEKRGGTIRFFTDEKEKTEGIGSWNLESVTFSLKAIWVNDLGTTSVERVACPFHGTFTLQLNDFLQYILQRNSSYWAQTKVKWIGPSLPV